MKQIGSSLTNALVGGFLVIAPLYLTIYILIKAVNLLRGLVHPIAKVIPSTFLGESLVSLLLALVFCLLVGLAVRTSLGRAAWGRVENSFLDRLPFYTVFRGLFQQLAGQSPDQTWKPALAEIEEALVPAFIIESFEDGRSTVFVPSSPTPFAGTVYILTPDRVHPADVPFARAFSTVARWGSGSKRIIEAMKLKNPS
jgi:uncharacterized membrane protein